MIAAVAPAHVAFPKYSSVLSVLLETCHRTFEDGIDSREVAPNRQHDHRRCERQ